ncbi:MAG: potassium transporter TrkG [Ruminococcus sp.]
MLLLTSGLTICGGLGFVVMLNIAQKRRFRRFSCTKVVLTMTVFLLLAGTLLLHVTQDGLTWMQSFFYSAVTRTSGFSIYNLGDFSNASLLCMALLMFVGAAPGSTGGGIKVTTLFVCIWSAIAYTRNQHPTVFRRRFSQEVRNKALMIFLMGLSVVLVSTFCCVCWSRMRRLSRC